MFSLENQWFSLTSRLKSMRGGFVGFVAFRKFRLTAPCFSSLAGARSSTCDVPQAARDRARKWAGLDALPKKPPVKRGVRAEIASSFIVLWAETAEEPRGVGEELN